MATYSTLETTTYVCTRSRQVHCTENTLRARANQVADVSQTHSSCLSEWLTVSNESRGCQGYIPEEYIHALYPYPVRIRAGDAYIKCIMRKRGADISILSDKNCKIISDRYSRYERQDTGIYKIIKVPGQREISVRRSPPLFSQSDHREIHVQAWCSDKRQSRSTRKKPFKHATRPSCHISKLLHEFQNGLSDDRLQKRRGTAWTAPVGAHTSNVNITSYLTSI